MTKMPVNGGSAKKTLVLLMAVMVATASALPLGALGALDRVKQKHDGPVRLFGDSWVDCGQGNAELALKNVTFSPNPVQVGQDFTLILDTINENSEITGGTFKTEVFLVGVPVYSETDDLCNKHTCPLNLGSVQLSITTFLPNSTPPGWYSLTIRGLDQDGLPSMCANIKFTISPW